MDTKNELEFYKKLLPSDHIRIKQSESVYKCLVENFNFSYIECIETGASQNLDDGCFGIYLAKICESNGGIFHSVDISDDVLQKSERLFNEYFSEFETNHHCLDSVQFLKSYQGRPNLVHLDSFDLNLENPIPSMLHGWLEFVEIKDKMPSGSIILVDDNFLKYTWIDWLEKQDGQLTGNHKRIDITYDIVGKGSLIYHWCQKEDTEWDIIGNHYIIGDNIKLVIKKR